MTNLDTWTPRQRPDAQSLDGRTVRLERLDWRAHLDGLFACVGGAANTDIWRFMPIGPFLEPASLAESFEASRSKDAWETLVIRRVTDARIMGMASFMRIRAEHGSAEIGSVAYGHDLQRTTMATETVFLMARYLFDDLGYRRFEWKCNAANAASMRAATRYGFTYEGLFRQDMVSKGENRDTAWYSMLDSEWPRIKAALEFWLEPSNFRPDGAQIRSLADIRTSLGSEQHIPA